MDSDPPLGRYVIASTLARPADEDETPIEKGEVHKMLAALRLNRLVVVAVVVGASIGLFSAGQAQAYHWGFHSGGPLQPGQRTVSTHRTYNYGAGVTAAILDNQTGCIGAKDNPDGTGGNAIPFSCFTLNHDQTAWTPGGTYGYGYGTLINNSPNVIYMQAILNIR
ncbi:MAG TPA: hypothetical protein VLK58_02215 [Conexibacter sp.]|nr:hypothetical protein [Conexibacter sp.]